MQLTLFLEVIVDGYAAAAIWRGADLFTVCYMYLHIRDCFFLPRVQGLFLVYIYNEYNDSFGLLLHICDSFHISVSISCAGFVPGVCVYI